MLTDKKKNSIKPLDKVNLAKSIQNKKERGG